MSDLKRVDGTGLLGNLTFFECEDGPVLEAMVLAKYMTPEGKTGWIIRYSEGMTDVEGIGIMTVVIRHEIETFEQGWQED